MTVLVGFFERPEEAERAARDLAEIGIAPNHVTSTLEQGKVVLTVQTEDATTETIANVLRRNGASDIQDRAGPDAPMTIELERREDILTPGTLR